MAGEPVRKRSRERTPRSTTEAQDMSALLKELRLIREEQRLRGEELRQLREMITQQQQISRSNNPSFSISLAYHFATWDTSAPESENLARETNAEPLNRTRDVAAAFRGDFLREHTYKLKPDTYDGGSPSREFFSKFELIARANRWDEPTKVVVLVSSLRGRARAVLECVHDVENIGYAELKEKLQLRFGGGQLTQNCYTQFVNRRQKFGESLADLGTDIEKLSRLAYSECTYEVRDKIACAQYILALSDGFIKRTLQLEGVVSLKIAIEKAKAGREYKGKTLRETGIILMRDGEQKVEERSKSRHPRSRSVSQKIPNTRRAILIVIKEVPNFRTKKTVSPAVFDPWFFRGTKGECRDRDLGSPKGRGYHGKQSPPPLSEDQERSPQARRNKRTEQAFHRGISRERL